MCERTAGMVRGARDSGYDRVGLGDGDAEREAAPREAAEVSSPDPTDVPPSSPDAAHSPSPTPPATTTVAAATAISPRFFPCFTCFADERRLCWLTAPTYGPERIAGVHHAFRNSPVRVKFGHPSDTS